MTGRVIAFAGIFVNKDFELNISCQSAFYFFIWTRKRILKKKEKIKELSECKHYKQAEDKRCRRHEIEIGKSEWVNR